MVIQRDLTPKRSRISKKIHGSEKKLETTLCPKNGGVHTISHDYWVKANDELCMCMHCGWTFIKSQQHQIPTGLIKILPK